MIRKHVEIIARVCHEANAAWSAEHGETSLSWAESKDSAMAGVRFLLSAPDAPASAQHDAWSESKIAAGWIYGPVKDAEKKTHPCLVAFSDLPPYQQAKDRLFQAVVKALME